MWLQGTVGGGVIQVLPGHRRRMASMFLDIGVPEAKASFMYHWKGGHQCRGYLAALFRWGKFHFSLWILCFLPSLAAGASEDKIPDAVAGMEFGLPAESTRCRYLRKLSIFGKTCTSLTFWWPAKVCALYKVPGWDWILYQWLITSEDFLLLSVASIIC